MQGAACRSCGWSRPDRTQVRDRRDNALDCRVMAGRGGAKRLALGHVRLLGCLSLCLLDDGGRSCRARRSASPAYLSGALHSYQELCGLTDACPPQPRLPAGKGLTLLPGRQALRYARQQLAVEAARGTKRYMQLQVRGGGGEGGAQRQRGVHLVRGSAPIPWAS